MAREATLSPSRLSALDAVVSAACDDIYIYASSSESYFEDTGGLFNLIRTVVDTQVAAWIRRRNAVHSPVCRLPSRVFRAVLYPLRYVDRLAVACVCKQWKNWSALCSVLLPFPDYITDADSGRFNAELAVMRHPPLELKRLYLELSVEYFSATVNFTLEHMWHIETLDVSLLVESGSHTNDQLDTLIRCLSTPAPRLCNLRAGFQSLEGVERFQDRCDWFGGHAPNLRRCDFIAVAFYMTSFSSVRTASFWIDDRTRPADILAILTQFPCLEYLCLESEESIGLSIPPFIASSRLKHLWIDSHLAEDLRNIDFSVIAHIFLREECVLPMPRSLQRLMPNRVLTLEICPQKLHANWWGPEYAVRVRVSCTQRSSRVFSITPPAALDQLPNALFVHTTTLSVHNFHLLEGVLLPDMPSLASLTIYISVFELPTVPFNIFGRSDLANLRELILVFTFPPGAPLISCAADEIVPFLSLLSDAAARPLELVIRGADIVDPDDAQLRSLVSCLRVEPNVRIEAGAPLWVRAACFDDVWAGNFTFSLSSSDLSQTSPHTSSVYNAP